MTDLDLSLVEGRTTPDTLNQNPVLAVGTMAGHELTHGKTRVEGLTKAAKSVDDVFAAQQTLFKDIESDLQTTIDTLLRNQSDSLTAIEGEKLRNAFSAMASPRTENLNGLPSQEFYSDNWRGVRGSRLSSWLGKARSTGNTTTGPASPRSWLHR
ncbi:type VII secretion system-associated protein [Streptomyces griseoruber]